jgi:homoisocitrate dehydrogenase
LFLGHYNTKELIGQRGIYPFGQSFMFRSRTILKSGNFYSKKIALMPADGIGKEVVPSAEKILRNFTDFSFVTLDVGFECFTRTKSALPEETIQGLKSCDGAIFGV